VDLSLSRKWWDTCCSNEWRSLPHFDQLFCQ